MKKQRSSGVLMHISSLPGKYGIGTLGKEARDFADLLSINSQQLWQVLPINCITPQFYYSPYASTSTFAGNIFMINIDKMFEDFDWIPERLKENIPQEKQISISVDYSSVSSLINRFISETSRIFYTEKPSRDYDYYLTFCEENKFWLDDFSLFMSLSDYFDNYNWLCWEKEISFKTDSAITYWKDKLQEKINFHKFSQYVFFKQWNDLKKYCNKKNIKIVGDIPIYVSFDSSDAWSNPDIFLLDGETRAPVSVAGVPPDYFSETGQRWGNPLYKWFDDTGKSLYAGTRNWWIKRISHMSKMVDVIRIDHFRAFESYWAIPATEKTAVKGKWEAGPGELIFKEISNNAGNLEFIAEDLGIITPEVEILRENLGFPGMKILQFAFDGNTGNKYLPCNFEDANSVIYTGTHDNNTTNGWYNTEVDDKKRKFIKEYINLKDDMAINWDLIRLAMSSVSRTIITPAQDILGHGADSRMNTPGTVINNWKWKLRDLCDMSEGMKKLKALTELYNRDSHIHKQNCG